MAKVYSYVKRRGTTMVLEKSGSLSSKKRCPTSKEIKGVAPPGPDNPWLATDL
jgi:hypothetical protein